MVDNHWFQSLWLHELSQDRVADDVTAKLLREKTLVPVEALVFAKAEGVFSGEALLKALSKSLEPKESLTILAKEGQALKLKDPVVSLKTNAYRALTVERTLLNFLSHLCGIATKTRKFVEAVQPHPVTILATRKTIPGLRDFQLEAVVAGGGRIHRRSLSDGVLIKENHQTLVSAEELIRRAKQNRSPLHGIEIEVQDLACLDKVLENPPDWILLDNLSNSEIETAVQKINGRCSIEASGGMTLARVKEVAPLGVNAISVGELTHTVTALDLSLDIHFL